MERHPFGSIKREVAVIGRGAWYLDRASAISALRQGLDLGMTHIDTAELYGSGAAEEVVAEAIAGRRNEVFLVSKVLPKKCLSPRDDSCLRGLAGSPEDRPAGFLPVALAQANTRLWTPSRPSSSSSARGRSSPRA